MLRRQLLRCRVRQGIDMRKEEILTSVSTLKFTKSLAEILLRVHDVLLGLGRRVGSGPSLGLGLGLFILARENRCAVNCQRKIRTRKDRS